MIEINLLDPYSWVEKITGVLANAMITEYTEYQIRYFESEIIRECYVSTTVSDDAIDALYLLREYRNQLETNNIKD